MAKRPVRQYDDDDGHTVCDMNVPGMPWYERERRSEARQQRRDARQQSRQTPSAPQNAYSNEPFSFKERLSASLSAALAGLAVVGVIALFMVLFVLFCTNVWLA